MADNTTKSADNNIKPSDTEEKPAVGQRIKAIFRKIFKLIRVLVLLILFVTLLGVSFAAGIYFKFINMDKLLALESVQKVVHRLDLPSYPVIGKYFIPGAIPAPAENTESLEGEARPPLPKSAAAVSGQTQAGSSDQSKPTDLVENNTEPEETPQEKAARLEEEKKRIAKLSRLYGEMKADQAVPILNQLEDDLVVAIFDKMEEDQVSKILARFDPGRAARITEFMAKGKIKTEPVKPEHPETSPNPEPHSDLPERNTNSNQIVSENTDSAPLPRN